jgi:hypothetical protein
MHGQSISLLVHGLNSDLFAHSLLSGEFVNRFSVMNVDKRAHPYFLIIIAIAWISSEVSSLGSGSGLSEFPGGFIVWYPLVNAFGGFVTRNNLER